MIDPGKDIRRNRKGATELANKIAQSDFMQGWLIDNEENFVETMNLIRDGAPVKWAELYMRAYSLGIVKEQNININFNRQEDRNNLQALVRSRVAPSLPNGGEYTPYEEIKPKKAALKRED